MITQLYDRLTRIPLFRGVSGEDLAYIADRVNLRWMQIGSDQPFIQSSEPCHHLAVLMGGEMLRITHCDGDIYILTELLTGLEILEPEQLYGLHCRYRSDYRTRTSCQILLISKEDIRQTFMNIPVFRINWLNLMSVRCNRLIEALQPRPRNLKEDIMHFMGPQAVSLRIRMIDLGRYLGAARKTISDALHELEEEGRLRLRPNYIEVVREEAAASRLPKDE